MGCLVGKRRGSSGGRCEEKLRMKVSWSSSKACILLISVSASSDVASIACAEWSSV